MAYGGRFIDFVRNLTAKSTTIDGTEQVHIDSSGLSQKATLANVIRYGGGSPRSTTAGNATVTQTTDGTLYLEVAGQTAGNARGAGAFDWQAIRTNASYVAGAGAVCIGANLRAADRAVSLGSSVFGGFDTQGIGYGLTLANYSSAIGYNLKTARSGQFAFGIGAASNDDQAQGSLQTLYTFTSDATSTPLNIYNIASARFTVPATRSIAFIGIVQAMCNVSSTSNFIKAWEIKGVITRDGNNTTRIVGTPIIVELAKDADGTPTPSTWAITSITADDTNEALAINVTGQAGQTIRWQCVLMYSQVGF